MIKAVVFDLDGMVHRSEGLFSKRIEEQYHIPAEDISEFFINEYKQCRIGELDTKDALQPYLKRWGFKGDVDSFLNVWHDYGEFDEEMLSIVKKLKEKGVRCILVTNNEKYRMQAYADRLDIFDDTIYSYKTGFLKPEDKMLELILSRAGCRKEEILFCDDKPEFIQAAAEFGFRTYQYSDIAAFRLILKKENLL